MKILNNLNMDIKNWKNVVSSDSMRPVMTGVYFDLKNKCMVGTNSHMLLVCPIEIEWTKEEIEKLSQEKRNEILHTASKIVPIEIFDKKKYMGDWKSYCFPFLFDFSDEIYAQVFCGSEVVFRCRYIDGNYPNYKAVIPDSNEEKMLDSIGLNLDFLQKIYNCMPFQKHLKNLKFTLTEKNRPIRFVCNHTPEFYGVLMPIIEG